ncbi:hypothetical protein RHMOL_Rhmol05G0267200 [Rhododendron molle]|uniref:Uncharacterized protein n=1 Tax=Rhododendron molle TaxID=49168 RepID=A0ACC0NV18_RHOML|nr:hypothetical protein RHMOL_Rhmol05G0267200 [Rhododendron molle]
MNIPTSPLKPPLPPPPAAAHHSWLSNSSPLFPIITILALVIIVVLIYAAFFAIRCPTTISNRLRRSSGRPAGNSTSTRIGTNTNALDQLVSSVAYKEAADAGKDSGGGGGECPVCLTAFVDGEVIREVKVCKHLFHDSCIDVWLRAHSSCPVCRVFVGTKRSKRPVVGGGGGDEDFRQGLPNSASLV